MARDYIQLSTLNADVTGVGHAGVQVPAVARVHRIAAWAAAAAKELDAALAHQLRKGKGRKWRLCTQLRCEPSHNNTPVYIALH